jgi:hypothetical protein
MQIESTGGYPLESFSDPARRRGSAAVNTSFSGGEHMNQTVKTILVWMLILVAAVGLWNFVEHGRSAPPELSLTEFLSRVDNGDVAEVKVDGSSVTGKLAPER